jgi:hypothetical protein
MGGGRPSAARAQTDDTDANRLLMRGSGRHVYTPRVRGRLVPPQQPEPGS